MKKIFQVIVTLLFFFSFSDLQAADLKKIEEKISDSVISTKLTAKFTKDSQLNPFKIYVSTQDGNVTLRGHVRDTAAYIEALRLAKSTKGVKSVDVKQLEIKPVNTAFTDAYITAKIQAVLLKTKLLDDESIPLVGINATTSNGEVTLTGKVKRKESIEMILNRVRTIRGVKKVKSLLTVDAGL